MAVDDSYSKLLLHFNGTNDSTTFTDEAGKTVTPTNAVLKTATKKFGTASGYFGNAVSSGALLTVPNSTDFNFGSGNFTIDCWIYMTSSSDRKTIFYNGEDHLGLEINGHHLNIFAGTGSSWDLIDGDATPGSAVIPTDTWTHIALVRNGNNWRTYINGTVDLNLTVSGTIADSTHDLLIGGGWVGNVIGYLDEYRVSKGIARWTSNFTPPTMQYPVTIINNLTTYYKLDESSGNAADSIGSKTLTNNNTITYSAGKINNGANFTASSSQTFSTAVAGGELLDKALTTGDMTISMWMKWTTIPSSGQYQKFFIRDAVNFYYAGNSGTPSIHFYLGDYLGKTITFSTGVWYHLVYTRTGTTAKLYIDGSDSSATGGAANVTTNSSAMIFGGASNEYFNGSLDEIGIWNRVLSDAEITALYNSGNGLQYPFTPKFNSKALVVAGGGGGGCNAAGGGGGGGVVYNTSLPLGLGSYPVVVGGGGAGRTGEPQAPGHGDSGGNSTFAGILAYGGGGGGNHHLDGNSGGSGGGGGGVYDQVTPGYGGNGTTNQGYAGGDGLATLYTQIGGGGGGASEAGDDASANKGGNGGEGLACSISGSSQVYGSGGGGAIGGNGGDTVGYGGTNAGDGGLINSVAPGAGTANFGGGGGGAGGASTTGGAGGSGVVIISAPAGSVTANGGTKTTSGGYDIWTFTADGTFEVTDIATTSIKSVNGLAYASIKSINGLAVASVKSINGLT